LPSVLSARTYLDAGNRLHLAGSDRSAFARPSARQARIPGAWSTFSILGVDVVLGCSTRMGATAEYGFRSDLVLDRIVVWRLEVSNVAPLRPSGRRASERASFRSSHRGAQQRGMQRSWQPPSKNPAICTCRTCRFMATISNTTPILHHSNTPSLHPTPCPCQPSKIV